MMKPLLIGLCLLSIISCKTQATDPTETIEPSNKINIEAGGVTLLNSEVENGEVKFIQIQIEREIILQNEDSLVLQTPGYGCYKDTTPGGERIWKKNTLITSRYYLSDSTLSIQTPNPIGGTRMDDHQINSGSNSLQKKWYFPLEHRYEYPQKFPNENDKRQCKNHSLEITSETFKETREIHFPCFSKDLGLAPVSKEISCSELEIQLPELGILTVKKYVDEDLNYIEEFTLDGETCTQILNKSWLNKKSCNLVGFDGFEGKGCYGLSVKLREASVPFQFCNVSQNNDGRCNENCINFRDSDCE